MLRLYTNLEALTPTKSGKGNPYTKVKNNNLDEMPSYVEIGGNDLADELAKLGPDQNPSPDA